MNKCYICGKGQDENLSEIADLKGKTYKVCFMCMMSSMRVALNDPALMTKIYVDSSYMRGVFSAIAPQLIDMLKEKKDD